MVSTNSMNFFTLSERHHSANRLSWRKYKQRAFVLSGCISRRLQTYADCLPCSSLKRKEMNLLMALSINNIDEKTECARKTSYKPIYYKYINQRKGRMPDIIQKRRHTKGSSSCETGKAIE